MTGQTKKLHRRITQALGRKPRPVLLLIVVVALLVVVVLAVALPEKSREAPAVKPPPINVEVRDIVLRQAVEDSFILHAVIEPNATVMVASEVSGQIESIGARKSDVTVANVAFRKGQPVAEGEPVAKGDCLVKLNTELLQAEYDRAKAQFEYDQRDYTRMQELFEKQVAGRQELDRSKTNMAVSKATLAEVGERLDRTSINSPIDGILNDLPEEVGQFVQPGTYVAEIVDIDTVKVVADVPERDVRYLRVGDEVEVFIDSMDGRQEQGRITFISELAEEMARTTRVEASVNNQQRVLRSGQIVRVRLTRRILKDVIMIPLAAVIPLEDGYVVYVASQGKADRREVEIDLGLIRGAEVRVTQGLQAGDKLIVAGHRYLGDQQEVVVRDTSAQQE